MWRLHIQVEKQATTMRAVRRPEWFERFAWFVSSENYLVLSAHDAQQSDLLVKRYLRSVLLSFCSDDAR